MYHLSPRLQVLQDSPSNIDFHIRSGDYFSFLATMMGVLEDTIATGNNPESNTTERQLVRELRNDLRYVQANYRIEARPLGDIQVIRPKGNLLAKKKS
jgi:hypothetical protein